MMKRTLSLAVLAVAALASGCANSGFQKATEANTARATAYQEGFLEQAANDLTAINDCWVNVKRTQAGTGEGCIGMSIALRMSSTFLYAFLGKPEMGRVPAAPEEIVQSVVEKGMNFALMKFGIDAVRKVVDSGQLAQAQIASEGIAAASKPPLIIEPFVVEVPAVVDVPAVVEAPAVAL